MSGCNNKGNAVIANNVVQIRIEGEVAFWHELSLIRA